MSDKSFGDYTNRNIVKNPLLSSAVTGLSIEDLTHNAVLLPAVPSQEIISRQDKQSGDQKCTLGDANRNLSQIGDANFNATLSDISASDNHHITNTNQLSNANQSKASSKSDDFDVNEYFARLQGTRYVSAPLNSCLTENLQSEENLEEINLNEEKAQGIDDTQHSITSDIAQNFSQLPTVLPQVASVVFSSFSSMLNLKSREQTPDESREFYNAPVTKSENLVPSIPEPLEVAPPPLKEPPVTGIPNYRITTKKKVYAQIPGLSYDSQNTRTFPPTTHQAPPAYFIPEAKQEAISQPEYNIPPMKSEEEKTEHANIRQPGYDISSKPPEVAHVDLNRSHTEDVRYDSLQTVNQMQMPPFNPPAVQQTQVIPPPPMFSNVPRKDSQSLVEKTILPPSVARRIGANQPLLKHNPLPSIPMQDIFVPSVPDNTTLDNTSLNQYQQAQNLAPIQKEIGNFHSVPQFPPQLATESQSFNVPTSIPINESQNLPVGNVLVPTFEVTRKSEETYQPSVLPDTNAPTLFNPNNMLGTVNVPKHVECNAPSENTIGQYFSQDAVGTPPKTVLEPPRISNAVNFRLAKKKPQYYAGPIEGVGSISNNVKPILNPVEPTAFQGSLFTPNVKEQAIENIGTIYPTDQASVPFDISQTAAPMYTPFDNNQPQEPISNFNTAFDMSRPTTERFEQANEPKGFGIIGSLKSKLSSIDINKIQSTVTTFFDPAYNDTKVEQKPMSDYPQYQSVPQYTQNEGNLEIFVPILDQPQTYTQPQNYQSSNTDYYYQHQGFSSNEPSTQYGDNNLMSTYYQGWQSNQLQFNAPNNSRTMETNYGNNLRDNTNQAYAQQTDSIYKNYNMNNQTEQVLPKSNVESSYVTQVTTDASSFFESSNTIGFDSTISPPMHSFGGFEASSQKILDVDNTNTGKKSEGDDFGNVNNSKEQSSNNEPQRQQEEADIIDESFTTEQNVPKPTCIGPGTKGIDITAPSTFEHKRNKDFFHSTDEGAPSKFFGYETHDIKNDAVARITEHQVKPTDIFQSIPSLGINDFKDLCIPFSIQQSFGPDDSNSSDKKEVFNEPKDLNQPLLSYFRQASEETSGALYSQHVPPITSSLHASSSQIKVIDARDINTKESNASNLKDETSVDSLENQVSELNICETCREVNKPEVEEKEVEDLTTQLIENITAPIQLLNPVGGPMPVVESQFSETPIPENIIENIKPVIDLLEDDSPAPAYGWSADNDYAPKALTDHNYSAQVEPNAIGFFQNKSLSYENIPKNASDEIKAGFQTSQDDYSTLLRQLGLPTAPPEEETKSDEGGPDVHSIEQDAKNDFPIYEEFTIEPSKTDDDKIETKERTKSVEEIVEEPDSFTNRVARFKRMETSAESGESVFDVQKGAKSISIPTSISPALTIASYFDTGNYAVETHYKNSLTSPTTTNLLNVDSLPTISIPPGFEDEYKRRLSGTNNSFLGSHIPSIPFIPDTTTQTSVTDVLTISQCMSQKESSNINECQVTPGDENKKEMQSETERLPAFSNMLRSHDETQERVPQSVTFNQGTVNIPEEKKHLEDPISFFSTEDTNEQSDAYNNFSRLSSYFTTPSKPDHSKSFFELSQSQNHYRHNQVENKSDSIKNNVESFFENQNKTSGNTSNIPENYKSQMGLVQDLASTTYYSPKDYVVTTVGYFTVEYVNKFAKKSIGEPEIPLKPKEVDNQSDNEFPNHDVGDKDMVGYVENIVKNCKKCCDMTVGVKSFVDINTKDIKVRKRMDENLNDSNKNGEEKMESKGDAKKTVTVSFLDQSLQEEQNDETLLSKNRASAEYSPVKHHWFYQADAEDKCSWRGFSVADSMALENAYNSRQLDENTCVPTDGGRFDVNVVGRLRVAVYWPEKPTNVIRCSWFYKGTTDGRYVPYSEAIADLLEEEYRHGISTGEWHRRLTLPNNVVVVMHGPTVMVHFQQNTPEDLTNTPVLPYSEPTLHNRVYRNLPRMRLSEDQPRRIDHLVFMVHGAGECRHHRKHSQSVVRTWVVRRGYDETEIEDSEPFTVDHLLLLCHGVGSACDMRFRPVEKVVDDFRLTSLQLIQSHYKNSYDSGLVGRVEVLPISWHSKLHSGETGVDRRLAAVTLDSIPKLRNFTNDTILDVLFYTSPVFCQTIIDTVCSELNRIYKLFRSRNPDFKGGVSLGGHSLGSVILYDLLCHQLHQSETGSPEKAHVTGTAGTGQPMIKYPRLDFRPDAMYALGSPIAMFECIRGVDTLGQQFRLPTCKNFFNIFHPYDPIAYRIEPMINPILRDVKPLLIPHHKGRKRMHLELKDTMARVGADIKARLMETIRSTWSHVWKTAPPPTDHQLEKVVEEELEKEQLTDEPKEERNGDDKQAEPEMLGSLNGGRRVDHVLQEAPFEMINEYLFAMRSHVCYWESEDTMLLMLREIYDALGVRPDSCLPQQNMTVHRTRTLAEDTSLSNCSENASTSRSAS